MTKKNLVITGCGIATSLGCNSASLMHNIVQGKSNYRQHLQIQETTQKLHVAYVNDDQLNEGINPRILRKLDRFTLLIMQAFHQTHTHLISQSTNVEDFGILLGNLTGGWTFVEPQMEDIYNNNLDALSPYVATAWFPTAPQGEISLQYKIAGYSKTFAADSLSTGYALEHACYLIQNDYLPGAFVGGVEAPLSPLVYNACIRQEPISVSGQYLPFHKKSDGYLLGEGAGLFAVEPEELVTARNQTPLARILGIGIASSLSEAMKSCIDNAKIGPEKVNCIFLDAKGVLNYDYEEYNAISEIFNQSHKLYLTTTKPLHGSLLAADFAVQIVIAIQSLVEQTIPRGLWSTPGLIHPSVGKLVTDNPIKGKLDNILIISRNLDGFSVCVLLGVGK